ncbi:MAG: methyltransferase family protein [Gaiellaceae bacterium]
MNVPRLGRRGEGWVALQFVVLGVVLVAGFLPPGWPAAVRATGVLVALAGAGFFAWSFRTLGPSMTPLPRPRAEAALVDRGPYRLVRHPIYGAGLIFAAGYALATSPAALVPAALLVFVFALKSRLEEAWLEERYSGYADYRRRTPRRFVPWLF